MAGEQKLPIGPVGRFVPCPVNGDAHPERLALQVKRTYDKRGKERFHALCPLCTSRIFLNNWKPGARSRTIVMAEAEGLHPVGVTEERKAELLREIGLQQVMPTHGPWGPAAHQPMGIPPLPPNYRPKPKPPSQPPPPRRPRGRPRKIKPQEKTT